MRIYKQTTKFTCGPAAILMILNHYFPRKFSLTRENELRFWQKSVRSPTRGTSIFALASILKSEGLKTKVYVGKIRFSSSFWKRYKESGIKKEDMDLAAEVTNFYYKDALKNKIKIEKKQLVFADIDRYIKKSDFLILRTNIKVLNKKTKNLTHYVVISEVKDQKYHVFDPYNGKSWLERKTLKKAFTTVKTICKEDYRALIVNKETNTQKV